MKPPPLKKYQQDGIRRIERIRQRDGSQLALLVAPPGAGKTRVMLELAKREVERGGRVLVKANRRMLIEQLESGFKAFGLDYGVITPDHAPNDSASIQIASTQTLYSRCVRSASMDFPAATLMLNDEAHQQGGAMESALLRGTKNDTHSIEGYLDRGGVDIVGFTATPVFQSGTYYQHLVELASYSDLRDEGMHQVIRVYTPDEIDTAGLTVNRSGEFPEQELSRRAPAIVGSVYDNWKRLNPDALPALLFAPSVECSRWFAHEFRKRGVKVAHIDGEQILLPEGDRLVAYPSIAKNRAELLRLSESGEVACVMNRFVLREAIDMPWIYHGIFATVMGGIATALQSAGRLQRFFAAYDDKLMQDHGGFYWRHGTPNANRAWQLGQTANQIQRQRVERLRRQEESEGICCPKCGHWRTRGKVCVNPECRHLHTVSVRRVRQLDGELREIRGRVHDARPQADLQRLWLSSLFAAGRSHKTCAMAVGLMLSRAHSSGTSLDEYHRLSPSPPRKGSENWTQLVREVFPWTNR